MYMCTKLKKIFVEKLWVENLKFPKLHSLVIAEILSLSHFFDKNFVKATFVLKKLLELVSRNIFTDLEIIYRVSTL